MGQEHLIEPSPGSVKLDDAESTRCDEEAVEEALNLADFDADIGKGAAADLSDCTFYTSTDELLAGLNTQADSFRYYLKKT